MQRVLLASQLPPFVYANFRRPSATGPPSDGLGKFADQQSS
jgi:hypothetical protein